MKPVPSPEPNADLDGMTAGQLLAVIEESFGITVAALVRAGRAWRRLEELTGKKDLPARYGLYRVVSLIAAGALLPEIAARFLRTKVFGVLSRLPIPDQRDIVERGWKVPVAVRTSDGEYTEKLVEVAELAPQQARVVFGEQGIRTIREQVGILTTPPPEPKTPKRKRADITVNAEAGIVYFGNVPRTIIALKRALRSAGVEL